MINLLGTGERRDARLLGVAAALADPAVHLHLYDKRQVFERRKMGHLTVLGRDLGGRARASRPCPSRTQLELTDRVWRHGAEWPSATTRPSDPRSSQE